MIWYEDYDIRSLLFTVSYHIIPRTSNVRTKDLLQIRLGKEFRVFRDRAEPLTLEVVKQLFQQKNPRGRTASVKRETRLPDILSWARFAHTKWHDISAHFLPYLARPLQRKPFPALFGGFFVTASWRANCLSTSTGSYQAVRMAFETTLPL